MFQASGVIVEEVNGNYIEKGVGEIEDVSLDDANESLGEELGFFTGNPAENIPPYEDCKVFTLNELNGKCTKDFLKIPLKSMIAAWFDEPGVPRWHVGYISKNYPYARPGRFNLYFTFEHDGAQYLATEDSYGKSWVVLCKNESDTTYLTFSKDAGFNITNYLT